MCMDSLLLVFNASTPVGDHIPAAEVPDDVRDNVCDRHTDLQSL